jgi:hypothetical protein
MPFLSCPLFLETSCQCVVWQVTGTQAALMTRQLWNLARIAYLCAHSHMSVLLKQFVFCLFFFFLTQGQIKY